MSGNSFPLENQRFLQILGRGSKIVSGSGISLKKIDDFQGFWGRGSEIAPGSDFSFKKATILNQKSVLGVPARPRRDSLRGLH